MSTVDYDAHVARVRERNRRPYRGRVRSEWYSRVADELEAAREEMLPRPLRRALVRGEHAVDLWTWARTPLGASVSVRRCSCGEDLPWPTHPAPRTADPDWVLWVAALPEGLGCACGRRHPVALVLGAAGARRPWPPPAVAARHLWRAWLEATGEAPEQGSR